ncbi:MAG: CcoQ/FixQ family Cbb3-type cytochrome c oxidase assembly chaperone [Myxococcales bacterium]|nr:CcoQ/FixQ family Cbb3-type cytochrome c oxidase assembly chaperone [Myxococcales bacterium]
MGAMGLAGYAEIALLIFFVVFVGVVVRLFRRDESAVFERARFMPLDDDLQDLDRDGKERG